MRDRSSISPINRIVMFILLLTFQAGAQQMLGFTYDISKPAADTRTFIPTTSMLGFGLDGRQINHTNTSFGVNFHWNVFKESDVSRFENEDGSFMAIEDRSMDSFPILLSGHYYFGNPARKFRIFLGGNVGTYFIISRQTMGGNRFVDKNWHFGLAPEAGFMIDFIYHTRLMLTFRHNYAFKTGSASAQSYFSLIFGFASVSFF